MILIYQQIARGDGGTSDPRWVAPHPDPHQLWRDPDDGSLVGTVDTGATLDAAGLLARAQSIHARYPITDPSTGAPYTDEALESAVTAWISAAGA